MENCRRRFVECTRFFIEATAEDQHIGKFLWSPQGPQWRTVGELKPGDCVIHYLSERSGVEKGKKFVGISKVASPAREVDKQFLLQLLAKINARYDPRSDWFNYKKFWVVELRDFVQFPSPISLDEALRYLCTTLPSIIPQNYLREIEASQAFWLLFLGCPHAVSHEANYSLEFAKLALISGKNVLFVGAPGVGKTRLAIEAASYFASCGPFIEVGRDGLTYDDLMLHFIATSDGPKPRLGPLAQAIIRSWEHVKKGLTSCHFIFDEINRAHVDLALGRLFTALDVGHRLRVPVLDIDEKLSKDLGVAPGSYKVPLSFRVLATMNLVDRAQLFRISFALLRRFAYVYVPPISAKISPRSDLDKIEAEPLDVEPYVDQALYELTLENPDAKNDMVTLVNLRLPSWPELVKRIDEWGVTRLLGWVVEKGDRAGVEVGPSLIVDALKLMAVFASLGESLSLDRNMFLDYLFSSIVLPYFSAALPRIRQKAIIFPNAVGEAEELRDVIRGVERVFGRESISWRVAQGLLHELPA